VIGRPKRVENAQRVARSALGGPVGLFVGNHLALEALQGQRSQQAGPCKAKANNLNPGAIRHAA
jgi:hypothetical protein